MPRAKLHFHHFIVEGSGHFPLDMLRYDACYPQDSTAVANMAGICPTLDHYTVELVHCDNAAKWQPTVGRWRSFGWRVMKVWDFLDGR